jgi:hypothetical protein
LQHARSMRRWVLGLLVLASCGDDGDEAEVSEVALVTPVVPDAGAPRVERAAPPWPIFSDNRCDDACLLARYQRSWMHLQGMEVGGLEMMLGEALAGQGLLHAAITPPGGAFTVAACEAMSQDPIDVVTESLYRPQRDCYYARDRRRLDIDAALASPRLPRADRDSGEAEVPGTRGGDGERWTNEGLLATQGVPRWLRDVGSAGGAVRDAAGHRVRLAAALVVVHGDSHGVSPRPVPVRPMESAVISRGRCSPRRSRCSAPRRERSCNTSFAPRAR